MVQLCRTALVALALACSCAPALAGTCVADWTQTCTDCWNNDPYQCTGCEPGCELYDLHGDGRGVCFQTSCAWKDDDAQKWYGKILVGSVAGGVITLAILVTASLSVCCGRMKGRSLKPIAAVLGVIAGLSLLIPLVTAAATSSQVVDDVCSSCQHGCTSEERDDIRAAIGALGVFVAYIAGFGFIVVILGSVSMILACCMCCPRCGPLKADQQAKSQGNAQSQVVGQPVGQNVVSQGDHNQIVQGQVVVQRNFSV